MNCIADKQAPMKVRTVMRERELLLLEHSVKTARPLNVCMIGYTAYNSDGRVMRYAETLAKHGDRVDFIALSKEKDAPAEEVLNGVHLFRIQTRSFREKSQLSYLFGILSFLCRTMWFLLWRQRKVRYDLVHVHSVPDFLVFSAWLPKLRGAKIILDIHDLLPEFYASKFECGDRSILYRMLLGVERMSAAFADYVIAANDIWYRKLVNRTASITEENCTAILNFPDREVFFRRGRTRNDGKFIMLFPGSLNWHQGVDIAIRALARIKDAAPNAEFHVYHVHGESPTVSALTALAENLGVSDRVFIQGSHDIGEMASIMENADLGIVPKRNNPFGDEAFSTKSLEFMLMGLPVIMSSTKIDRYYFNDTLVKFFPAGDDAALAKAMLIMIRNPELRNRLARNALEFAKGYDWESNQYKYLNIVSRLTRRDYSRPEPQPRVMTSRR
jgi:glycosyltransferase involved in cell wall biosynthesis